MKSLRGHTQQEGLPESSWGSKLSSQTFHDTIRSLRGLVAKGSWSIADQGLFASSNFVLNVLLARWLIPEDYGAFTIAFSMMILMATIHSALFVEPMLVFAPSRYKEVPNEYLDLLLYGHWRFALPVISLVLLAACLISGLFFSRALAMALLGLALAGPFICFLWLVRRACYARFEPHLAAAAGAIYMLLLLAGTYVVYRYGWLSTGSALGLMGLSSLITGYWLTRRLSVSLHGARNGEFGGEVLRRHLGYGRWAVMTSMLMWVPSNVFFLLLPIWNGLDASAALKALWNFILPILQVNSALAVLLVPMLVGARQTTSFESFVRRVIALFAVGSIAYWILLGLMHRQMIDWLYGGKYANYSDMLWLLGLVPVASGIVVVTSGALRALEKPEQVFRAYALSTIVALGVGVGLISIWGVVGAVVAILLSYTVTAIFMTFRYLRARKTFEGSESES